jgi:transcriptional regulator with XRE-family HTH domain
MPDDPQAISELASFGEELRREREIRGISLKEISDATKISKRFLEAIERNDHKTLPAPVFTRGFVREYARYLGLNADEIVNRYNYAAAGDERIEKSPHLERLVQMQTAHREPPQPKGIPPPYARVDRNVYILIVIVAALAGLTWWAVKHKRAIQEVAADVGSAPAKAKATVPVTRGETKIPVETTSAPQSDMLRLTIEAIDDSWISLEADGKTVINDELRRGTRRTLEAKDSFHFRTIGNAGGIVLTLNDVRLPALGSDGQVIRDKVIDRAYLEQVRRST